jgi:MFS transporter, ACS family, solute carrier family 17 (sodium-dependent inorganic phosphate cotransporter), other
VSIPAGRADDAHWPRRYNVLALCFAASFICYIDRVNISVASIAMKDQYGWTDTTKGVVLSSFFVGYMATQILSGWFANRYGGKRILGFAVVWWSFFTMLTPVAAGLSLPLLLMARIALGLGESATYPASYSLFRRWIPTEERSRAVAIVLSGVPMGTLVALLVSGWVIVTFGWPMVFYAFGLTGFLWAMIWYAEIHDDPLQHPRIAAAECGLLAPLQASATGTISPPVPWARLLSQPGVWAIVVNHFCSNWALYMLLAWLPSYFHDALHVTLGQSGIFAAAPWLSMFLMSNVAGWLADNWLKTGGKPKTVRRAMQTIGLLGPALFLLLARDVNSAPQAVLLMSGAAGTLAFGWAGYASNHHEIAPRYADVLLGISNTAGTLPGVIGVAATGWLLDLTHSYATAFIVTAAICTAGLVVWWLFATSDRLID